MRLLHSIMYEALPSRGYVRPYYNNLEEWEDGRVAPTGNLFIEIGNYYDHPDESHGLLEKVYQYTCKDGILPEKLALFADCPLLLINCLPSHNSLYCYFPIFFIAYTVLFYHSQS